MLLSQLLKGTDAVWNAENDVEIKGVAYNSQKVQKGWLFVAIKGFSTDGHKYIPDALAKGAAAVIIEDDADTGDAISVRVPDSRKALAKISASWFENPAKEMKIIGVTGTNGKTTVTSLIKQILEFSGKKVGLIGTNGNMIGDKLLPGERTTPESYELHELFREMADVGTEYVVMEVSSHSLSLSRVYGIEYEIATFTNLTQDHLDFHVTMENYFDAKKILFNMCNKAVINADDVWGAKLLETTDCPKFSYSIDKASDFKAENVRISARGILFDLVNNADTYAVRLGIPGKFSVYNAMAAVVSCISLGLAADEILTALTLAQGVKGRAETVYTNTDYTVIIDYAHTPDGLENIISTVREFAQGRVITLFGCGGDRDSTKRPVMGEIAGKLSDFCIITSDNPRTEEPMPIIRQIEEGMKKTGCEYITIENRREAIGYALKIGKSGDCIILAGKGHETYQIIGKEKRHFDEREVIKELLEGMNA
ncbi:MAG: UDP-N-acetylmuramoyl-L-alanyl-D-glutamate--2,6-diaminopimelate ligase [Clostridia bacterium]|nr:UDP-N-acetylmuramoyl-L-alanyl-D-glutamate--2,6-diaminopimelate ligase [Clostridia bacterium]